MARYIGPVCRLCRAEGKKLFLKGDRCRSDKCPINKKRLPPGKAPKTRIGKKSEYALQLREKQALKRAYGLMERQFRNTFEKALGLPGKTGDNLIILLERRLDNVVYRMHFAVSRAQARQLVNHGHIAVNGKRVNIASYLVRPGDIISVIGAARKMDTVRAALEEVQKSGVMPWLEVNADEMTGRYVMNPQRQDVTDLADVKEQMIVELYSK